MNFGPTNAEERAVFAEENLRVDVQVLIYELMLKRGISATELARRLGTSETFIKNQVFNDKSNLRMRTFARILNVLGSEVELKLKDV